MSILTRYEQERAERINREAARATAMQGHPNPTAGAATHAEVTNPRNYKPPVTVGIPGFEATAKQSAQAGGLESEAFSAVNPATEAAAGAGSAVITAVKTPGEQVNKAIKSAEGWTAAIGHFFEKLGEASTWLRVLKFVLGGVLIIVALVMFTHAGGSSGGETTPGVRSAGAIGGALKSPALSIASAAAGGSQKAASAQRKRTTRVSPGTRKRVQEGRARERARPAETDRKGKPLSGTAARAREKRRVKERAQLLGMKALS